MLWIAVVGGVLGGSVIGAWLCAMSRPSVCVECRASVLSLQARRYRHGVEIGTSAIH